MSNLDTRGVDLKTLVPVPNWLEPDQSPQYYAVLPVDFPAEALGMGKNSGNVFWAPYSSHDREEIMKVFELLVECDYIVTGVIEVTENGGRFIVRNENPETNIWSAKALKEFGSW